MSDGMLSEATTSRYRLWHIDRFLARRKCKPEVAARLRRFNPDGVEEGRWPRGYHPGPRNSTWEYDGMSPRDFVAKYGRAAYDAAPKSAFIRRGHRKMVKREYIEDYF